MEQLAAGNPSERKAAQRSRKRSDSSIDTNELTDMDRKSDEERLAGRPTDGASRNNDPRSIS